VICPHFFITLCFSSVVYTESRLFICSGRSQPTRRDVAKAAAATVNSPNCRNLVAWRSGNALCLINEVNLRRAQLVLGWMTACRQVNHLGM